MDSALRQFIERASQFINRASGLLPDRPQVNWKRHRAAVWNESGWTGGLEPVTVLDPIRYDQLLGIDEQKRALASNTQQFCKGYPANNALLWGARGTGKSSLIHALLNEMHDDGLRVVEVEKQGLEHLPHIASLLAKSPYRFLVVCDDLSFEADDASYRHLKSALEGSVFATTSNVLIYATSNRRHLVPEFARENQDAHAVQGEIHHAESVEERISLSDRFGLWLAFHPFNQELYLETAAHWLREIAAEYGRSMEFDEELRREALQYALLRGTRNGRTANHFARRVVGREMLQCP